MIAAQAKLVLATAHGMRAAAAGSAAALRAHAGLYSLVALHMLAAVTISAYLAKPYQPMVGAEILFFVTLMIPLTLCALLVWRCCYMLAIVRPPSPGKWLLADVRSCLFNSERLINGVLGVFLIIFLMNTFGFIKDAIPQLNAFSWDIAFAQLDRSLHFGLDPWLLLQPVFGWPAMTTAINFAYHLWFFVMFFLVIIAAFSVGERRSHFKFLYSFILLWIVAGNVLAVLLSSAGPVYYERLGFGSDFAPLMAYLHDASQTSPVWALHIQEELWKSHVSGDGLVSGISAMPSLHVASATLFVLYGFQLHRALGWTLGLFAVLILLGSVHLGWHYAIDGYAGAIVALACWWAGSKLTELDLGRYSRLR